MSNDHAGDTAGPKEDRTTRFTFLNINGVNLRNEAAALRDIFEDQLQMETDLAGYGEINVDTTQFGVKQKCYAALNKSFERGKLVLSSSSITTENEYKPGGTMIVGHDDIVGRMVANGTDRMGRWSWTKLSGCRGKRINFIVVYQVCSRPTNKTGITAYHQQENILRLEHKADGRPRKNFQTELISLLKTWQNNGESIILVGDLNEPLVPDTSNMAKVVQDLDLVDIFRHRHPHLPEPATYIRERHRIDYALLSQDLCTSITACGYEPFHYRTTSNHRQLFLDFDTAKLFGNETERLAAMAFRDIRSKDAKSNTIYLTAKYQHLDNQNFFTLCDRLSTSARDDAMAARLDDICTQGAVHGGKKCRSRRRSWWSHALTSNRMKANILRSHLNGLRTQVDLTTALTTRMRSVGITMDLPTTTDECQSQLKTVQAAIRTQLKDAVQIRLQEMEDRAELAALDGKTTKNTELKKMRNAEKTAEMFRRIKTIRGIASTQGFTSIEVPDDWPPPHTEKVDLNTLSDPKKCDQWRTVDVPDSIVYYLLLRNRKHFGQAQGTPFTEPPFSTQIDWEASTCQADLILHGEYEPSELDDLTELLINHCRSVIPIDKLPALITEAEFISRFKTWNERTSTSPSGLHLGHYKALIGKHSIPLDTREGKALEAKRKQMIRAQVQLINYAMKHGYVYPRWKTVVNVMIEKEPGNAKIHHLRVIHLYEADYNFILGVKWRQMLYDSDKAEVLHRGQFGGRPGCEALTPVFMEELKNEISHASRKSLINFDNDAASCYDRIIPALASLIGRKHGIHQNVIYVNARTLQEAKYKLKTLLGISDEFYQNCTAYPIYGTGQGSANSPVIWLIISSTLFTCHEQQAYGATFTTPDKTLSVALSMVGFVDDSTGQVNDFTADPQPSPETLNKFMQYDAQLWSDLLWLSGGLLELPKCSYHHLHFSFEADGRPTIMGGQVGPSLVLTSSHDGSPVHIPQKPAFSAHKTLGHWKAPAGNGSTQLRVLREKSQQMASQLLGSPIRNYEAWRFYGAIYLKAIGYVLPNCHFTATQLQLLQSIMHRVILPKCGYNRKTARAIIHGPSDLCGGQFLPLYTMQGEGQILQFLKFWRTKNDTGKLLRVAVAWLQLHTGVSFSLLDNVTTVIPHTATRWLPSLRTFLASINGTIQLDRNYVPPMQRVHDEYIMDTILRSAAFTNDQIKIINYCRLYLQVVTVSDICHANGTQVDAGYLSGYPTLLSSQTTWITINQARPADKHWELWQLAIRTWCRDDNSLYQPLGDWLDSGDQLRRQWPFYYDLRSKFLYVRHQDQYLQYEHQSDQVFIHSRSLTWTPHSHSLPVHATMLHGQDMWQIQHPIPVLPTSPLPQIPETFQEYVDCLPLWEQDLFAQLEMSFGCYTLLDLIDQYPVESPSSNHDKPQQLSSLIAVSDGSSMEGNMTFGWTMSLPNGQRLAGCAGPAPGSKDSSFRAEAYGMLSMLRFLFHLTSFCAATPTWQTQFSTDNQPLLKRIREYQRYNTYYPNATANADWDVLQAIVTTCAQMTIVPFFRHVKGHQDDKTAYDNLPLEAQLNVDADHEAGAYYQMHPHADIPVRLIPGTCANLTIAGDTISSGYKRAIRTASTAPPLMAKIQERNGWTPQDMHLIHWKALGRATRRMPSRMTQLLKLSHDLLPTAAMVHRYDPKLPTSCMLCRHDHEDRDHILQCPHHSRHLWRHRLFTAIRKTGDQHRSRPALVALLIEGLDAWFRQSTVNPALIDECFHPLLAEQDHLGWRQIFNGRCPQMGRTPRSIPSGNREPRLQVHRYQLAYGNAHHCLETIFCRMVRTQRHSPRKYPRHPTSGTSPEDHPGHPPMVLPREPTAPFRPHRHTRSKIRPYSRNR